MEFRYGMYCAICGYEPKTARDIEENRGTSSKPVRYWDPDDGWRIGHLCRYCYEDTRDVKPNPKDYAYDRSNGICDTDPMTDLDPMDAFLE